MRDLVGFIESGAAHLRVRHVGTGRDIVFIHGWALDSDMWAHQVDALAREYRVVTYDRRGFGLSSGTPSIEADVLDLDRVLEALHIERAAIVGMSQGARVAAQYACENPKRVTHAIFDSPPELLREDGSAQQEIPIERFRDLVREHGLNAFAREWSEHPLARLHTCDPKTRTLLERIVTRYPGRDLLSPSAEPASPGIDPQRLEMPVLIVNGAYDVGSRQASGRRLEQALPMARRAIVPAAGHLPCLDNPTFYNDTLRWFLDDVR